ncbi:APC family permease [Saccharopolyspora sp. HNM0983]|uniref:APC family permease n=1 Tax=Saccharopolyspora montiporae TaxID=2781240 RepID=A0A929FXE9_9PSEU|nr:APC family permease [Saccharopolyspora sp. HNM0983]MBE9374601.1 APC family permease [Saccharopolyspora sp. HNM0983]
MRTGARPRLSGRLGTASIVFMVLAAAAPLTVIGGNVPLAIGLGNGAGAPVGFLIAAAVLLIFSVGFVAMTPHVTRPGAFSAYVQRGLGEVPGGGTAFLALAAYTAIQAGIWGYLGGAASGFLQHHLGAAPPWWACSAVLLVLVGVLGYRRIELSSKVLGVALVCELGIVLVLDAAILAGGGASGISGASFTPAEIGSGPLGIAVLFSITGFIGFEATAVFRHEVRDPDRSIPRATYTAVLIIGLFYALSSWSIVEGWGVAAVRERARQSPDDLMLATAERYLGPVAGDVLQVLLLTSLVACVLSFHNVLARYQFALAGRGSLPAALGRVHPRHGSPATSSLVQTATAAALIALFAVLGLDPLTEIFGSMAGVATLGVVLLMLLTSVAALVFFARERPAGTGRVRRLTPAAAIAVLLVALWLVVSHFPLVADSSVAAAYGLGAIPVLAFGLGCLLTYRQLTARARRRPAPPDR